MLPTLRRSQILATARQRGGVSVRELSRRFNVSVPTIRRDLSELAGRGLVARVHGGALAVREHAAAAGVLPGGLGAPDWTASVTDLVHPGMAVGISAGPAALRVARLVAVIGGLTVVTPAPAVADAAEGCGTVVVVGGVRTPGGSHAGPLAVRTLRRLNLDIAFVQVSSVTGGRYLAAEPAAVETDRALLAGALRRVLLVGAEPADTCTGVTVGAGDPADVVLRVPGD